MRYKLVASEIVDLDLQEYYDYIVAKEKTTQPAKRWYTEMKRAINEVCDYPEKHMRAPEFEDGSLEIRESRRYSHRIVFKIDKATQTVYILRVYHLSRKPLNPKDVGEA